MVDKLDEKDKKLLEELERLNKMLEQDNRAVVAIERPISPFVKNSTATRVPSKSSKPSIVKATYDYDYRGKRTNVFSFLKDDEFEFVEATNKDWIKVQTKDGRSGYVPTSCVEVQGMDVEPDKSTEEQKFENEVTHVALYDFQITGEGQVALVAGEQLVVTEKTTEHWWQVRNARGETGIAPTLYLCAKGLGEQRWFHRTITAEEAATRLESCSDGAFLVTESALELNQYLLYVKVRGGKIQNTRIFSTANGFVLDGDSCIRSSINDLLSYYRAFDVKSGWGKLKRACAQPADPYAAVAVAAAEEEEVVEEAEADAVPPEQRLQEIETRMAALHNNSATGTYTAAQRQELKALQEEHMLVREQMASKRPQPKRAAPPPPSTLAGSGTSSPVPPAPNSPSSLRAGGQQQQQSPSLSRAPAPKASAASTSPLSGRKAAPVAAAGAAAVTVEVHSPQAERKAAGGAGSGKGSVKEKEASSSSTSSKIKAGESTSASSTSSKTGSKSAAAEPSTSTSTSSTTSARTVAKAKPVTRDDDSDDSDSGSRAGGGSSSSSLKAQLASKIQSKGEAKATASTGSSSSSSFASEIKNAAAGKKGSDASISSVKEAGSVAKKVATVSVGVQTASDGGPVNVDEIKSQIGDGLLQAVRDQSGISFSKSRLVVESVITYLLQHSADPSFGRSLAAAVQEGEGDYGVDAARMEDIFTELTTMKNDGQQRSWSIYDDSPVIEEFLGEFLSLADDGNPVVVRNVIREFSSPGQQGHYEIVETLITYYQMETRIKLRMLLLKLFLKLSELDPEILLVLQLSVLPVELARDIAIEPHVETNLPKTLSSLVLLTMIFAQGYPISAAHEAYLNKDFVSFLFDLVEYESISPVEEAISTQATHALLGFNMQYDEDDSRENLVMSVLGSRFCKIFGEKVMLLFNRDEDPLAKLPHARETRNQPHSVLKLFINIFSSTATGHQFLYTNDLHVLVEVLLRELTDQNQTDELRVGHARVLDGVFKNSAFWEDPIRVDELKRLLTTLEQDENLDNNPATNTIKKIASEMLKNASNFKKGTKIFLV